MFIDQQPQANREKYYKFLQALGSLSGLFSDSPKPYLHYRCHENVFCRAFGADNEARSDIAVDAVKSQKGVGLKTFLYDEKGFSKGNPKFEKIAEFNQSQSSYKVLKTKALIRHIAELRNKRLDFAERSYRLQSSLYHCVIRLPGRFLIYEDDMSHIDIDSIDIDQQKGSDKSVSFSSSGSQYRFNHSKSTLFRAFSPTHASIIDEINIDVVKDPYQTILDLSADLVPQQIVTEVVLPLYSPQTTRRFVPEKSGLNQWNAGGRLRNDDEAYIPIPAWVHRSFPEFFPARDYPFDLRLPDGKILSAKVCQDGSKALMSNPNKALGDWILRQVLNLNPGELLTYDKLLHIGIDSVGIVYNAMTKGYSVSFRPLGSYEKFDRENRRS